MISGQAPVLGMVLSPRVLRRQLVQVLGIQDSISVWIME